ncbi:hypothetical protein ANN_02899 [Periplaneta americana]|uniref:Uncharacterized protein n=1 Tax=Periplaneta americana TaxID=6978 RepID=A0ABQ8TXK3_PERAM|nr:hypothetical protein ANN_02899 [Periplaneta americana]
MAGLSEGGNEPRLRLRSLIFVEAELQETELDDLTSNFQKPQALRNLVQVNCYLLFVPLKAGCNVRFYTGVAKELKQEQKELLLGAGAADPVRRTHL